MKTVRTIVGILCIIGALICFVLLVMSGTNEPITP